MIIADYTRRCPALVLRTRFSTEGVKVDLGLKNRVAAVAAASQGLGFAAAKRLALEGARVGICSRSRKNIDAAARCIENETGTEVFRLVAELSNADEATGFVDAVAGHFGSLDVLVTNAGGPPPGGFEEIGEPA